MDILIFQDVRQTPKIKMNLIARNFVYKSYKISNSSINLPEVVKFGLIQVRLPWEPDTVVTDLGYRSAANFKTAQEINNVFLGRSEDVSEKKQDFCCKARSATEGFIAVAKNLRGFGRSLYKGFKGDRIWSLLCQTASNLKKFIQLWTEEKIEEKNLVKLGLLT